MAPTPRTYAAIRGLDAFDPVCAGIRAAAGSGVPVSVRVTIQAANYRQFPAFIELARSLGAHQVSFVAVDVANPHAFGRVDGVLPDVALKPQDLPQLQQILARVESDYVEEFRSGFIAESPRGCDAFINTFPRCAVRMRFRRCAVTRPSSRP